MIERLRFLVVGLYAWVAAVFWGSILLDMAYANNLKEVLGSSGSSMVFSKISDTLLFIGSIMIITAIAAIAISWKLKIARNLFIASLLAFSFEFSLPILSSFIKTTHGYSWIRPFPGGIASILAFIGLFIYYRQSR